MKGRLGWVVLALLAVGVMAVPASASAFGPISSFASHGEEAGQLGDPGRLAIAPDGNVHVAEYGNNRVSVFSPQGQFRFAFGRGVNPAGGDVCDTATGCEVGDEGGEGGALFAPEGVALDADGDVYVTETDGNRVSVFSPQGEFRFAFGRKVNESDQSNVCTAASGCDSGIENSAGGGLAEPTGIQVAGETVYVADTINDRISVFTTAGEFLYTFGAEVNEDGSDRCDAGEGCWEGLSGGDAGEMDEPADVKLGPNGRLVVSDRANHRLSVFTTDGVFLSSYGKNVNLDDGSDVCDEESGCREGDADGSAGSLKSPTPVSIGATGSIYVGDIGDHRVAELSANGEFIRAFGAGVLDGADTFQVCATSCQAGVSHSTVPGATSYPYGVAVDCHGAVYVAASFSSFARVERFGEPGTPAGLCTPAPPAPPIVPIAVPQPPDSAFGFGKLKRNEKKGTATLFVRVPGPGKLALAGKGVRKAKATAKRAGQVKLKVRAAGKAKRKLLEKGKARVSARVTFTPTGGTARTATKKLTLRMKLEPERR